MLQRRPVLAILTLVLSVTFAISPFLTSDFAGYRPEQFPVQTEFWPVQPAAWAICVCGLFYLWLIFGSLWGLVKAPRDRGWQNMRLPLVFSLGIGTFWVAAANASPILATVMIVAMAALAITAMFRASVETPAWQVRPVALYAGWLTAATGVGAGVVLGGYGMMSAQAAALVMLTLVSVVALLVQARRPKEWAYPLAVI